MDTFLNSIDTAKVDSIMAATEVNVQYFNNISMETAKKYSEPLDNLMKDLYAECIATQQAPTDVLEKYYLELANMLYFMGEKLEQLGIYADMSKSAAKEVYSKHYIANNVKDATTGKNKTTVAELQASSEMASQYENVVNNIYDRSYNILRYKINAGQDMLATIRKILSSRQAELQLSATTPNVVYRTKGMEE